MPLKLTCPRCKKGLTLSRDVAGSYTKCAHCGGRVWVPEVPGSDSPGLPGGGASTSQPSPIPPAAPGAAAGQPRQPAVVSVPPPAPPPVAGAHATPHTPSTPPSTSVPRPAAWTAAGQAQPGGPSTGAPAGRKARFVTASTAESRLQPAADGKLPGLKLEQDEPEKKPKQKSEGGGLHPLVLFCALCLSILVSMTMVLVDTERGETDLGREQAVARWRIEREYFSHLDPNEPLVRYQLLLREAHRAHARGDRLAERNAYRSVLALLRAERGRFEGLTGSPKSDDILEELITVILQE